MLFILDSKLETVGVLTNNSPMALGYFNDTHTEAIENNLNTFEFETASNHPSSSLLEVEGFIIYTDLDDRKHLFTIKEINDSHTDSMIKKIYCENSAIELIGNIVRPISLLSKTLEQSMAVVLDNTDWEVGDLADTGLRDVIFSEHVTSLEALHQVVKAYDVEMEYEVKFNGATVTKKLINIVEKRGTETGKVFEYGKDLISVERVEDTRDLVTALIGIGSGGINFASYKAPADKRFIQEGDFIYDMESYQRFNKEGKQIFGIFKDDKATNPVELYLNTKKKLEELSKPKLTYTCKVITLEEILNHDSVRIGDQVVVKDFSYDIPLIVSARVIELKRSKTDPSKDSVTLGDYVPITFNQSDSITKLQKVIFEKQHQWDEARQLAEEMKDNIVYKVELSSSNGLIFKNGEVNSVIKATVYKGKDDITLSLNNSAFIWKKFDAYGNLNTTWTNAHAGVGSEISISAQDVSRKATFVCEIDDSLIN